MKSRIITPAPRQIIGVNIPKEKAEIIGRLAAAENGRLVLRQNCANEQVGYLCGFNGFKASDGAPESISEEILLFSGFDSKSLNRLLAEIRSKGCGVRLKAIVTAHNQSWTVKALEEELLKEHNAMEKYQQERKSSSIGENK